MFGSRHQKIIAAFEADRSPSETRAACRRAAAAGLLGHLKTCGSVFLEIGVPGRKGPVDHACPHVSPTSSRAPLYARNRATPTAKPRNTSAATSHSSEIATTPMNADRTEMPVVPVGPGGYTGVRVGLGAQDALERSRMFFTEVANHLPPRAVWTPRALRASAISRRVLAPAF